MKKWLSFCEIKWTFFWLISWNMRQQLQLVLYCGTLIKLRCVIRNRWHEKLSSGLVFFQDDASTKDKIPNFRWKFFDHPPSPTVPTPYPMTNTSSCLWQNGSVHNCLKRTRNSRLPVSSGWFYSQGENSMQRSWRN